MDPLSLTSYNELAFSFDLAGRHEEAIEVYREGLELYPANSWTLQLLAAAYARNGVSEEAIALCQEAMSLAPGQTPVMAWCACVYGIAGRKPLAVGILDELKQRGSKEYVSPASLALIHSTLGETEQALELLELAYQGRDTRLVWLKTFWQFDPLRADPRFQDLLRRMNFAE